METNKLRIPEKLYNEMIAKAVAQAEKQKPENRGNDEQQASMFAWDSLPSIERLTEHGITPEMEGPLPAFILPYLVFYSEQAPVGKDEDGEDEYDYIFTPDPIFYSEEEITEFLKTRKFIERILIKKVEIVTG